MTDLKVYTINLCTTRCYPYYKYRTITIVAKDKTEFGKLFKNNKTYVEYLCIWLYTYNRTENTSCIFNEYNCYENPMRKIVKKKENLVPQIKSSTTELSKKTFDQASFFDILCLKFNNYYDLTVL